MRYVTITGFDTLNGFSTVQYLLGLEESKDDGGLCFEIECEMGLREAWELVEFMNSALPFVRMIRAIEQDPNPCDEGSPLIGETFTWAG